MHWNSYWWGTEVVSDTAEDEVLLKTIGGKLDRHSAETYENGHLNKSDSPSGDSDHQPDGGFTLTFNR